MENLENPEFLKKFKGLGNAPEVMAAKERAEARTGEKVKGDFESLIQNYLNRFTEFKDNINEDKDDKRKERAIERFKSIIMDKFITKHEDVPDGYWREKDENGNMGPFFREINDQGLSGDWSRMDDNEKEKYKKEHAETLIENQRGSLEEWLDYFMDDDLSGDIPDYLKYWAFRSVTGLQEYEKPKNWDREELEKRREAGGEDNKTEGQFPRRSKNSLKKYPDLHPEALRYVTDAVMNKYKGKDHEFGHDIQEDEREKFRKYLEQENFAKLYAWAMESFNPIPEELLPITEGQWVTYPKGSDVNEVVKKLKGKGTGLCIAGKGAAHRYLDSGDLHIFYSNDEEGNSTFPRIAIHGKGDEIAEMRGIAYKQNLDPFMSEVASAKCQEFQNGKEYEEKSEDMRRLTEIENKTRKSQELNKDDLIFLYEIDRPIKYFGMNKDPRIAELRDAGNPIEDASIVFDCEPSQIANRLEDITENTKAYIGELRPGIFEILNQPNIEHVYTKFPEGKVDQFAAEIGGRSEKEIMDELEAREQLKEDDENKLYAGSSSKYMLKSDDFIRSLYKNPDDPKEKWELKDKEKIKFIKLKVSDLGFPKGATTEEIYKRAEELGLELCPPEAGPEIRLNYKKIFNRDQSKGEYFRIGMKQITDSGGLPSVFRVRRSGDGRRWLRDRWAHPGRRWDPDGEFVFRPRKSET